MDQDDFAQALQELVDRARQAETILLVDLIGELEALTVGLQMAADEGEGY